MQFHSTNSENMLVSKLQQIQSEKAQWQVVTVHLEKISDAFAGKIPEAHKLIQASLKDVTGETYLCHNQTVYILYDEKQHATVEATVKKLRQMFNDDPLVHAPLYGDKFESVEDLDTVYAGFFNHVNELILQQSRKQKTVRQRDVTDRELFNRSKLLRADRERPLVLLAEDNPFSLQLAESFLNKHDFASVIVAENGKRALELYCSQAPDILFLDIEMPGLDGHEVLQAIDKMDKDAFVVMLTGKTYQEDVLKAKLHHARGYIAKPFTPQKLEEYIQRYKTESK